MSSHSEFSKDLLDDLFSSTGDNAAEEFSNEDMTSFSLQDAADDMDMFMSVQDSPLQTESAQPDLISSDIFEIFGTDLIKSSSLSDKQPDQSCNHDRVNILEKPSSSNSVATSQSSSLGLAASNSSSEVPKYETNPENTTKLVKDQGQFELHPVQACTGFASKQPASSLNESVSNIDAFSRAMVQLQYTNKKAAEIEALKKGSSPSVCQPSNSFSKSAPAFNSFSLCNGHSQMLKPKMTTQVQKPQMTAQVQKPQMTAQVQKPQISALVKRSPMNVQVQRPQMNVQVQRPQMNVQVQLPQMTTQVQRPQMTTQVQRHYTNSHVSMPQLPKLGIVPHTVENNGLTPLSVNDVAPLSVQTASGGKKSVVIKTVNSSGQLTTRILSSEHLKNLIASKAIKVMRIDQDGKTKTIIVPKNSDQATIANVSLSTGNGRFISRAGPEIHSVGSVSNDAASISKLSSISTPLMRQSTVSSSVIAEYKSLGSSLLQNKATFNNLQKALTNKDVSRLWATQDVKLKQFGNVQDVSIGNPLMIVDDVEEEIDELGRAETYAIYMPAKLKLGIKHPDPVVETSSLSSVEPPDVKYRLNLPQEIMDTGRLSALQLEAIVYACQQHETFLASGERTGFLIGDGAGVGKGRTIAGIIYENYIRGRKRALWLSVSNDLRVDAERDLSDIGAGKIEVHPLNKLKYAKISSHINGCTKKGVIFSTYSSLIGESPNMLGKYRTRFKQLIHWLGTDFDGPIIFDECHKAKNLCPVGASKPTKTGLTVLKLQEKLPKARIVYASATGASEPKNMAYMTRLGLWGKGTSFNEFSDFITAVEKRGVGAMELVAMDMKLRGAYMARQLSFHGVSFKIVQVPIPKDFHIIYNKSVKLWVEAREMFQKAADIMDPEHRMSKRMWGQFWSAHQRFFKYLCISAKVDYCIKVAREAIKSGKCVVIGLQSTGEARTLDQLEDSGGELNDFVSTAKGVFQTLVDKHFPAPDRSKTAGLLGMKSKFDVEFSALCRGDAKKRKRTPSCDSDSESMVSISSENNNSSDESDAPSEGDDNPFCWDDDDDPWLKKKSKKKKKDKLSSKKFKVKKAKRSKKTRASDSDDFDEIDKEMDRAMEAAGLKSSKSEKKPVDLCYDGDAQAVETAIAMKHSLTNKINELGSKLPPNTLDQLIDELGGSDCVAEMTGRKGRVVSCEDGTIQYESRSEADVPLETLNLTEKERFMNGDKKVAIISEAASSGISLQADRRVANQRRRVHITLELPWSADRAIQQFGRTHRSNQVSAPEYSFLISELAGEQRFAATVAKRLESLGALTHGDRRATESRDLSQFNIDNKFGRVALESVMRVISYSDQPIVPLPKDYTGNFVNDAKQALVGVGLINEGVLDRDYANISKFLNRILGMEVAVQNALFRFFTDTMAGVILQAKREGRWDLGILDLGSQKTEKVTKKDSQKFVGKFNGAQIKTQLTTVSVERGMLWDEAMSIWKDHPSIDEGFYISQKNCIGQPIAILAVMSRTHRRDRLFSVYKPNSGCQQRMETLDEIKAKYKKVLPERARDLWKHQYVASELQCSHAFNRGTCPRIVSGQLCDVGLRERVYHVLSGAVLQCWSQIETVISSCSHHSAARMQIIRLKLELQRIVGILVPQSSLSRLKQLLSRDSYGDGQSSFFDPQLGNKTNSSLAMKSSLLPNNLQTINSPLNSFFKPQNSSVHIPSVFQQQTSILQPIPSKSNTVIIPQQLISRQQVISSHALPEPIDDSAAPSPYEAPKFNSNSKFARILSQAYGDSPRNPTVASSAHNDAKPPNLNPNSAEFEKLSASSTERKAGKPTPLLSMPLSF